MKFKALFILIFVLFFLSKANATLCSGALASYHHEPLRIGQIIKLKDGTESSFTIYALRRKIFRRYENGALSEKLELSDEMRDAYVFDRRSGLFISAEAPKEMTYEEAKEYCESLPDLDLRWRLPGAGEFLKSGGNRAATNKFLRQALQTYSNFWTSTPYDDYRVSARGFNMFGPDSRAIGFDSYVGSDFHFSQKAKLRVRCVAI